MKPCNCYYGEDCTKTTVCANESIVEDLEEELEQFRQSDQVHREQRDIWKAAHDTERKDRLRLQERVHFLECQLEACKKLSLTRKEQIERLADERDAARRCHREAEETCTNLGKKIEQLEAQVEALQNKCARRGLSPEDSDALIEQIERLEAKLKLGNRKGKSVQPYIARIKRLEAVVEAAVEMRNDYEAYSYNTKTKKYDNPQHDPQILARFNEAYNAKYDSGDK